MGRGSGAEHEQEGGAKRPQVSEGTPRESRSPMPPLPEHGLTPAATR